MNGWLYNVHINVNVKVDIELDDMVLGVVKGVECVLELVVSQYFHCAMFGVVEVV